ncbi:hypothetical protein [Glutamicibacter sp. 2E12]|uniref:hypothetical protein n=1 Tax=Glutamicibacter sp. 2E12 TaxID=3416181 RepID=UPI003CFA98B6
MKFAEQFRCEIPSPDAIKEGVLYCSTNATNAVDLWVAAGTIGSAVAAVGLAAWTVYDTRRRFHHDTQTTLDNKREREWTKKSMTLHEEGDKVSAAFTKLNVGAPEELLSNAKGFIDAVTRYRTRTGDFGEPERKFGESLGDLAQMLGMKIFNLTQHYEIDSDLPKPSPFDLEVRLGFTLMNIKGVLQLTLLGLAQAKSEEESRERAASFIGRVEKLTDEIESSLP